MGTFKLLTLLLLVDASTAEYIFTFPKSLESNQETTFCLSAQNIEIENWTPGQSYELIVELSLEQLKEPPTIKFNYRFNVAPITVAGFSHCPAITAPQASGQYQANVTVSVEVEGLEAQVLFEDGTEVKVTKPDYITLIQTDKPLYKPGQTVKFRAMTMDYQLMSQTFGFSEISVQAPNGLQMMKWNNVSAMNGLVSLEMPLSSEPVLGKWTIKATFPDGHSETTFKVDEYVLPKFEVVITPPKYLLPTTKTVHGTVCAKYTYGKPVKGTLDLQVCFGDNSYANNWNNYEDRPCALLSVEIDGCYEFYINAELIKLRYRDKYFHGYSADLIINATVIEDGTGIELSGISNGPSLSYEVISLGFEDDSGALYKPGFPYKGRVKVTNPDGSPAANEEVQITGESYFQHYFGRYAVNDKDRKRFKWLKTFLSDENGMIHFVINDVDASIDHLRLKAEAIQFNDRYNFDSKFIETRRPYGYHTITRVHSASDSFIYIPDVDQTPDCGSDLEVDVYYTTPTQSTYNFQSMVKAGDRVVFTKSHVVTFDGISNFDVIAIRPDELLEKIEMPPHPEMDPVPEDDPTPVEEEEVVESPIVPKVYTPLSDAVEAEPVFEELIVPVIVQPLGNEGMVEEKEARLTGHFKMTVPITHDMSPDAQLLVYYMRDDGEIIASAVKFNIEKCFKNKVEMNFKEKVLTPGANAMFTLKASPNSVCFVGMVDKSINLLGGQNQITPAQVFEKVKNVARPYNWVSYWRENDAYCDRKFPKGEDKPELRRYSYTYLTPMGIDAIQSFRDFNTWILTDGIIETRPCKEEHRMVYYSMPIPLAAGVGNTGPRPMARRKLGKANDAEVAVEEEGEPDRIRSLFPETWLWDIYEMGMYEYEYMDLDGAQMVPEVANFEDGIIEKVAFKVDSKEEEPERIRSLFPETWLWDIFEMGDNSESMFSTIIPDTITEWIGNSLCTNPQDGIGVSELTSVRGFQPFFVSLTLPYAAVRTENMSVPVTVFNYLDKCIRIDLRLDKSDGYRISGDMGRRARFCLCGRQSKTIKFYIMPIVIGEIEIQVKAVSIRDNGVCKNLVMTEDYLGVSDGVQKHLLVEAEGVPQERTKSEYMCVSENDGTTGHLEAKMELPVDLVMDSERAFVSVVGDIMGPTLSNLKNLLKMPYGCGEQNMASWSPNIYVLQYLKNTNQLSPKIEEEALGYMRVGYQRQMKYRHNDYSYSAFGESNSDDVDRRGSIWLTAFVIKSMAQSAQFISIDEKDVKNSVNWILNNQDEDGCFPQIGRTFSSYLKGGLKTGENKAGLTAFIMIALSEAAIIGDIGDDERFMEVMIRGFECLDQFTPAELDTYTLTLFAYVLSFDETVENFNWTQEIKQELDSRANKDDGLTHWERKDLNQAKKQDYWYRASSAEVEMTAYVALAMMERDNVQAVPEAQPIIQWLTKQRNPYGGFSSTQDTVIALQALAMFGSLTFSGDSNVNVHVTNEKTDETLTVTKDNLLLYQSVAVQPNDGTVNVEMTGTGCALVQVSTRYNVVREEKRPSFIIDHRVYPANGHERNCAAKSLKICTRSKQKEPTNMAIIEVKMPTGWESHQDSIEQLKKDGKIARFEVDKNYVHLYFHEITRGKMCIKFNVEKTFETTSKPSVIRVYDYYERDNSASYTYELTTTCPEKEDEHVATKEDIPKNNEGLDCSIMQCRVLDFPVVVPKGCPICLDSMPDKLLLKTICDAQRIYKAAVARSKRFSIKLMANMTVWPKVPIDAFVNPEMDASCECQLLKNDKEVKAFFMTTPETWEVRNKLEALEEVIKIGKETTIIKLSPDVEKKVNRGRKNLCAKMERRRRSKERKLSRSNRRKNREERRDA